MTTVSNPRGEASGDEVKAPYLAIDQVVAREYLEYITKYPRSKQICICGHTVTSHNFWELSGTYTCKPNTSYCPCVKVEPVYFAPHAGFFKRVSHGPGMKHALTLGIVAMTKSGFSGEWLVPLRCRFDNCKDPDIVPAPVTSERMVSARPAEINVFLCRNHVIELGGDLIW
jgi:hypothetical protein